MHKFTDEIHDLLFEVITVLFALLILGAVIYFSTLNTSANSHYSITRPVFEHISYKDAKCNLTFYLLANNKADIMDMKRATQIANAQARADEMRKLAEEEERRQALENTYINIFGYVPTDDEISLIKHVAMHESGNTEPHEGIVALLACIANRARLRDGRFPNTIIGVGYQSGQMTCVTDGSIWNYVVNERVETAWQDFISGGYTRHPKIVSWTAGHYNPYFEPAYTIGHHCFGY